jgi:hypothetical protein
MKMTGLMAGALMAAAALAFPAPSQAQVPDDVFGGRDSRASRDDRDGYADAYRIGHDKGYQDGLERGVKGRSRGGDGDLIHDARYRKGDAGYKKSYGPRPDYIAGYRDGYEQAVRGGGRTADPYAYGRDGRYGRDRNDRDRDDRWGTDPGERDRRRDGRDDDRIEPAGRDDDDYDDDVVYEEPPGRW